MGSVIIKVCGITQPEDASLSLKLGAEKLGFILHEKSPRNISFAKIEKLKNELSLQSSQMVAVDVLPEIEKLKKMSDVGFGDFQLHFPYDLSRILVEKWTNIIGVENLWLAPKLPLGVDFPEDLLCFANTFLIDAYCDNLYGGTGKCSDWKSFSNWSKIYSSKNWILAGGLSPENIELALSSSHAQSVDVNSGVERLPGIKDHSKLKSFFKKVS